MNTRSIYATLFLAVLSSTTVLAQTSEWSLGPELNGFGVGAGVSYGLTATISLSAELGFLPINEISFNDEDVDYTASPDISGGIIGVHFHPFKGNFSLGVGLVIGKYLLDVEAVQNTGTVEIGNMDYPASDVGTLIAEFTLEGSWPALMLGWRGSGFNFGLGVAFVDVPEIDIRATGILANDPQFRADLDEELDEIRDELELAVLPLIRIGYQFGI